MEKRSLNEEWPPRPVTHTPPSPSGQMRRESLGMVAFGFAMTFAACSIVSAFTYFSLVSVEIKFINVAASYLRASSWFAPVAGLIGVSAISMGLMSPRTTWGKRAVKLVIGSSLGVILAFVTFLIVTVIKLRGETL